MRILHYVEKIPGGLMIVPLFLGALVKSFAPGTASYFGSFTQGIITGAIPLLAAWLFCMGTSIDLRATGTVLRKSGTLIGTKILVAWIVAFFCMRFLPSAGITEGFFAGLSTLAVVSALDMTNAGLYASLTHMYGSKEEAAASVLVSMESGPLVTMIILGTIGAAAFSPAHLVGVLIPFLVGFILGNLDNNLRALFSPGSKLLIPFFAFALGNTIDLSIVVQTGLLGITLAIGVVVISGIPLILSDIFIGGGRGTAGIAASSSAGAAVATPVAIAQINPEFSAVAHSATALVATCVVITSVIVPIVTGLWAKNIAPKVRA